MSDFFFLFVFVSSLYRGRREEKILKTKRGKYPRRTKRVSPTVGRKSKNGCTVLARPAARTEHVWLSFELFSRKTRTHQSPSSPLCRRTCALHRTVTSTRRNTYRMSRNQSGRATFDGSLLPFGQIIGGQIMGVQSWNSKEYNKNDYSLPSHILLTLKMPANIIFDQFCHSATPIANN